MIAVIKAEDITLLRFQMKDRTVIYKEALKQIKDTNYDQRYHTDCKPIWGIGVSFGKSDRNINGFAKEQLFEPGMLIG